MSDRHDSKSTCFSDRHDFGTFMEATSTRCTLGLRSSVTDLQRCKHGVFSISLSARKDLPQGALLYPQGDHHQWTKRIQPFM